MGQGRQQDCIGGINFRLWGRTVHGGHHSTQGGATTVHRYQQGHAQGLGWASQALLPSHTLRPEPKGHSLVWLPYALSVPYLDVLLPRRQVCAHEAEGLLEELKSDPHPALVPRHATEATLDGRLEGSLGGEGHGGGGGAWQGRRDMEETWIMRG